MYVARTSINRVISSGDLCSCLLPRCEALRIWRSGFPIATKWCCYQDVKVVRSSAFTQRTCDRCGSLWKGGDVVNMWREQAIIEWSRRVISVRSSAHMPLGISDRNNTFVLYQCLKGQEQRKKLKKTKEEQRKEFSEKVDGGQPIPTAPGNVTPHRARQTKAANVSQRQ